MKKASDDGYQSHPEYQAAIQDFTSSKAEDNKCTDKLQDKPSNETLSLIGNQGQEKVNNQSVH